jgi:hypothetical protein
MTILERASAWKQFLDAILSSGPDIQEDLIDLKSVEDAIARIVARSGRRFGKSAVAHADVMSDTEWVEIRKDSDVVSLEQQVLKAAESGAKSATAAGAEAPKGGALMDLLQQVFAFLTANPAILQLLLALLKKPATA